MWFEQLAASRTKRHTAEQTHNYSDSRVRIGQLIFCAFGAARVLHASSCFFGFFIVSSFNNLLTSSYNLSTNLLQFLFASFPLVSSGFFTKPISNFKKLKSFFKLLI